ncbi:MAG TPA: cupin domain-containing protein [Polyangiaceae bacterium]|nr:cupin domain-containing protein [Polyangiaceae bacterium]
MNAIYRYGVLCALILGSAAGCSDDESPSPGAAGSSATAGAAGALAGAGGGAGETETSGGAGGAIDGGSAGVGADAGAGGDGAAEGGSAGESAAAGAAGSESSDPLASSTVLDLDDVKSSPDNYTWFDFKPNVKKLILAGDANTQHIAILWYTVVDGGVGLHYHSKTESVYVIHGTQTDAKGVYTDGTVYFNPPGSGHQISDSSGFFLLAYAAPPDFVNTNLIEAYEPIRIDTTAANLTTTLAFTEQATGVRAYAVPLVATGGLAATLLETTTSNAYAFSGNYLLVLKGSCVVNGVILSSGKLVVAKELTPQAYQLSTTTSGPCLAMGVSF